MSHVDESRSQHRPTKLRRTGTIPRLFYCFNFLTQRLATKPQFDIARRFYLCRDFEMSKVSSGDSKNTLYCSFCGKSQHEVRKLIAGPTVFICDECVELCMDIIREE